MSFLMSNILTSCGDDSTLKGAARGPSRDNAEAQRSEQKPKVAALKNSGRCGSRKTASGEKGQKGDCNGFDTRFQGNNPCGAHVSRVALSRKGMIFSLSCSII